LPTDLLKFNAEILDTRLDEYFKIPIPRLHGGI